MDMYVYGHTLAVASLMDDGLHTYNTRLLSTSTCTRVKCGHVCEMPKVSKAGSLKRQRPVSQEVQRRDNSLQHWVTFFIFGTLGHLLTQIEGSTYKIPLDGKQRENC